MTRLLVLQQLFNLSDEQMEFQVLDRMSFQRFVGLKNSGQVPDHNTIWVFRERLVKASVEHQIFAEVQRQLQEHGLRAREGQIIDASIIRAPIQHNTADEQAMVKEQAVPVEWSPAKRRMSRRAGRRNTASRTSAKSRYLTTKLGIIILTQCTLHGVERAMEVEQAVRNCDQPLTVFECDLAQLIKEHYFV